MSSAAGASFRQRLVAGQALDGIVVRTPSHHVLEVLAALPGAERPDVVMIDQEHSPIDGSTLDVMLAVACGHGLACLARVAELSRAAIQQALDLGAAGVVVPHVDSSARAADAVRLAHFGAGGRGFSGSTRASGWGQRQMADVLAEAAAATTVIVQVEDAAALDVVDEIATVPGVDAVLVGTADLAVSLGAAAVSDDAVADACTRIAKSCAAAETALGAVATSAEAVKRWRSLGATLLLHGTDQSHLGRSRS